MFMLVFAAIGVFGAGMLAIAAGIPIKDYGFGNTLILSGVVAWCTSIIMVSLWACAREIRQGLDQPAAAHKRDESAAAETASSEQGGWPQSIPEKPAASPQPAAATAPAEAKPGRRNLLFASSRRTSGAAPETAPPTESAASAEPRVPELRTSEPRPQESRAPAPEEPRPAPKRAELPARPSPRPPLNLGSLRDTPRPPAAAPALASAPASAPPPREPAPEPVAPSPRATEISPTPPATAPGRSDSVAVNVLKSGVVDGMAYWLYSDGSIEAQMAEGMMRFGSIDELRAHLDKRA
jgi:hypothetical protein